MAPVRFNPEEEEEGEEGEGEVGRASDLRMNPRERTEPVREERTWGVREWRSTGSNDDAELEEVGVERDKEGKRREDGGGGGEMVDRVGERGRERGVKGGEVVGEEKVGEEIVVDGRGRGGGEDIEGGGGR